MKQITLTDIFLEVLARNSDLNIQAAITRIKSTLKISECAKLFNIILLNALGYKSMIKKDTVDRAIDCVIDKNKLEIDRTDLDEAEKEQQKLNCELFYHSVQTWVLNRLKESGQLIE